jgi:hypothetical protein
VTTEERFCPLPCPACDGTGDDRSDLRYSARDVNMLCIDLGPGVFAIANMIRRWRWI